MHDGREIVAISTDDPPVRIDPASVQRSILVAEAEKTPQEDDATDLIEEVQQAVNPTFWSALKSHLREQGPQGDARLLLVAGPVDEKAFAVVFESLDIPDDASLFVRSPSVSLDGGAHAQTVYAILVFRDAEPRIIISDIEPLPAVNDGDEAPTTADGGDHRWPMLRMLADRVAAEHGTIEAILFVTESPDPDQCVLVTDAGHMVLASAEPPFGLVFRTGQGREGWSHFLSAAGFQGVDLGEVRCPSLLARDGTAVRGRWDHDGSLVFGANVISAADLARSGMKSRGGKPGGAAGKPWWKFW